MPQAREKQVVQTKRNLTRLRLINSVIRETKQKTSCSNKSHVCPMETGTKHKAHYGQRRDPPSLHGHVRYTRPLRDYGYHSADWIERISHARTRRAHSRPHWRAIQPASMYIFIHMYVRNTFGRDEDFWESFPPRFQWHTLAPRELLSSRSFLFDRLASSESSSSSPDDSLKFALNWEHLCRSYTCICPQMSHVLVRVLLEIRIGKFQ